MDILDKYLKELDESDFDHTNQFEIEGKFQSIRDEFEKTGDKARALNAQLEMEVFSFTKTVENFDLKLSFRFSGNGKNDAGEVFPYQWPDSNFYKDEDYNYILKRFHETKNDYAKSEYGLLLLLADKSKFKQQEIAIGVIDSLIRLSNYYFINVSKDIDDSKHYSLFQSNILQQSFILSYSRRNNLVINVKLEEIKKIVFSTILNWNIKNKSARLVSDLSRLIIYYKQEFKNFDLEKILDKIWNISNELNLTYLHGGIELASLGLDFSKKILKSEKYDWLFFIGISYEKLAEEAQSRNDNTYISFIEDALRVYKRINNKEKINELNEKFKKAKTKWGLSTIKTPIPQEYIQESFDRVNKFLETASEKDIIYTIASTPMIPKIEMLQEHTKEMYTRAPLTAMLTKTVIDKTGKTIAEYNYQNKDEIFHYNLMSTYSLEFEFALRELDYLFIETIKRKLLTANSINKFLKDSWLGQDMEKYYVGRLKIIDLSKMLFYPVQDIFEEINNDLINDDYEINLMQTIDSLTLKFEYVFRFLCEKIGIPTYYNKFENKNIKEERSINSLLDDENLIKNFQNGGLEDDLFFYKFIFTDKAGWNLRNRIAHGLIDYDEYSYQYAIVLLIVYLKISTYKFQNLDNIDGDNSKE